MHRQVTEVGQPERGLADLTRECAYLRVRQPQELVQYAELVQNLQRRRVDRVAAKVTEKVRVLFEHGDPDARASEEKPEHHPRRTAAGDDTVHGQTSIGNVPRRGERPVPPAETLAEAIPERELPDVRDR